MYLKNIEITGFKSFADRTQVRLEPGITSVVGPNGCGKSNILDAMRWALGETRAKELRGSQMQDVIFNGSEERHALGMAEVTVTFDNADSSLPVEFAEVAVTRRVYRSGESEYLINKTPCRLRDVQELFMDTGIGTQAYSMIGQGKMDLLLSSKPEDRRFVFEEAAGIIKYKNRKRLAMRRLESAEQNLLRLTDIINEVERQMRSLKRQVNAAIRYRELTQQLREIEIRSAWLQFNRLREEIGVLEKEFAEAGDEFEGLSTQITKLEARHEELGLAKLEVDRTLMTRRESVYELDAEMERLERDIALLRQKVDFSREQQSQAAREQVSYEERAKLITESLGTTDSSSGEISSEAVAVAQSLGAKVAEHEQAQGRVAEADTAVEELRKQAAARVADRSRAQTEIETVGVTIANVDARLNALYDRQSVENARLEEVMGQLASAREREQAARSQLEATETKRRDAMARHETASASMRDLHGRWQDLRERKSSVDERLGLLRELRDSYEGFAGGVRAVMTAKSENRGELNGIIGPVGDLLSTDKAYERAIEAALGGNINNIVAEHADAAKAAIDYLKRNKAGRVTFLPLDILRGGGGDDGGSLRGKPGVIGAAIDFVSYDPHIQKAVEYLLHGTVIVETIDDAIRIAREQNRYPRLVTLDGDVVSSSGAVTGGRVQRESRGLLGRSAEIADLEEQLSKLNSNIADAAQKGQELTQEIDQLSRVIRESQEAESRLRRDLNEAEVTVARLSTENDSLAQAAARREEERAALTAQRETLEAQRASVQERAGALETDDETVQRALAEAQLRASEARHALSVCADELAELRIQQAGLNQRLQELEREKEREQRGYQEALEEAARRKRLQEELAAQQKQLEAEIATHVKRSKALSETKEEARKKVNETENERHGLLEESDALEKELKEKRDGARDAQSRVHRLEMDLRSREDRVAFFQERISTEYHIALASLTAEEVGTDDMEDDAREQLVAEIRDRLQRMGEVNLMAIEEYEQLEKRHDFLVSQASDLQQAREALLGVIARSDKKIREMFMETFNLVADHFRNYFRHLFNGGQARIYLLDEDDPLESGIEIEARPPGKKPQSISLLSGGESAMTAIALLFSVFRAKPTPFCVLDEVDAPLDDANIGRFLKMLDEFTAQSQFIVITHNKQTMAKADALYGVTMQERGVSKLVSVKFKDVETAA